MLTIFRKKKIKEDVAVNTFVQRLLDSVEEAYPEIATLINESPEFVTPPQITEKEKGLFLMVVVAGNLKYIPKYFDHPQDTRMLDKLIHAFAHVYGKSYEEFHQVVKDYWSFFSRVNHPSKNTLYAMSKALFYKLNLTPLQEEYFRNMKCPNPLFLKRMDEVFEGFLWNWDDFLDKYTVTS